MSSRFEASTIKNKIKREEIFNKGRKEKSKKKLEKRLERAKVEASNPAAKKKRREQNVPRTLDNMREFDPSFLTADPSTSNQQEQYDSSASNSNNSPEEAEADIENDPFASYFTADDPTVPPKVLITTSPKASKSTYDFIDELVGVFPGAEFIRRKKGKGFEMGRIAGWAAGRGYKHMAVVNEDMKKPNAITLIHLPNGPTAYFKLTSIQLSKQIHGHARATPHNPELVLNNFGTRLGHTVGRMFQTLFPPLPEFQGRQVVTLHNQRDFIFFRRHRYAFRSTEKVALQEIGPRFTLKLRSLRKGIPAVHSVGESSKKLEIDTSEIQEDDHTTDDNDKMMGKVQDDVVVPPKQDEFLWAWKPELEVNRRTFFL